MYYRSVSIYALMSIVSFIWAGKPKTRQKGMSLMIPRVRAALTQHLAPISQTSNSSSSDTSKKESVERHAPPPKKLGRLAQQNLIDDSNSEGPPQKQGPQLKVVPPPPEPKPLPATNPILQLFSAFLATRLLFLGWFGKRVYFKERFARKHLGKTHRGTMLDKRVE